MMGNTAMPMALFGSVWALLCVLASLVVLDTLMKAIEPRGGGRVAAADDLSSRRPEL